MKFKYIEFIRAFAAIIVLIGHIACDVPYLIQNKFLYLQMIAAWGPQAVVIFFVLSGVVINHTSKTYSNQTWSGFLKKRAIRIFPIYYFALVCVLIIDFATQFELQGIKNYIGSFFFLATLEGYITGVPNTISTVWSLSFEVFFYIIFSFTIVKNQKKIMYIWSIFSIFCLIGSYFSITDIGIIKHFILMFSLSAIWLVGYYIYEFKDKLKSNLVTAIFSFSIIPLVSRLNISSNIHDPIIFLLISVLCLPLFIYSLNQNLKEESLIKKHRYTISPLFYIPIYFISAILLIKFSQSLFKSKLLYIIIPLLSYLIHFSIFKNILKFIFQKLERILIFIASVSYGLYLIHLPIIYFFGRIMPNFFVSSLILIIMSSFFCSYLLEKYFQKKMNRLFSK